jgi:hypothetical protein
MTDSEIQQMESEIEEEPPLPPPPGMDGNINNGNAQGGQ